MAVSYLTKTDLNADLTAAGHLDPAVQAALIASLENGGVYDPGPEDGKKAWVEQGTYTSGPVPGIVQVVDLTNSATVQTSSTLKAIIMDDAGGNQLNVAGGSTASSWRWVRATTASTCSIAATTRCGAAPAPT